MQNPSPLSAPPSLLSLQSTLQGTVVPWSGVTMSSQHRAVSNLILQLAAQGCIIVAGSGLWGNNDLLRLPIHLFSKHIQWNKHINARDNIVTYASQPLISAGRWKVSLLKWVFPSLQESRSLWIGDGRPRRPLFPLIFFFLVVLENNFLWHVVGCFMALRNILVYSSVATIIILPLESHSVINQTIPFYSTQIIKIKIDSASEFVLQAE